MIPLGVLAYPYHWYPITQQSYESRLDPNYLKFGAKLKFCLGPVLPFDYAAQPTACRECHDDDRIYRILIQWAYTSLSVLRSGDTENHKEDEYMGFYRQVNKQHITYLGDIALHS